MAAAGVVQATSGIVTVGAGVLAAPETGGASLSAVPLGVLNTTMGSAAAVDGGMMVYAAIKGSGDSYSTFNKIGQQYGGETGGKGGDLLNLAGQLTSMALSPLKTAAAAATDLSMNALSSVLANAGTISGKCGP